jgi:8-oxo-dGTP pyrophosphatase MutT (NUDIX family)
MEQGTVFSAGLDLIPGLDREALRHKLDSRRGLGLRSDLAIAKALGADDLSRPKSGDTRPAAVLVPLVMRPQGATVMLTRRTAHLNNHAGQISFPGGRLEDSDADATACALREAEEETGLSPQRVEVLGTLDDYITITGFRVVPVVALVHPPFDLAPDAFEVDEVFEVPLAFLLDPANHQKVARTINGRLRPYYAIPYQDYYIWGATAGMLMNLYSVVSDLAPES